MFAPLLLLSLASSAPAPNAAPKAAPNAAPNAASNAAASNVTSNAVSNVTSNSDAYLWQRDGNAAAVSAFTGFSSGRLHVLASDDDPKFVRGDDGVMQALRASQVPVIATVRVKSLHDDVVFAAVRAFAGANVKAVEVDYDCAASQLAAYATWLRATQHTLGDVPLAITALPSWLDHVDHNAVFDAAREVVLQVHSVRAPALLDVKAAVASVKRAQAERPTIRIALPTYAVSLKNGAQQHAVVGDVVAVKVVASRIAWFRFPGDGDDGAWDLVTLGAVDGSSGYSAGMALGTTVADDGARLLHVRNTGAVALPFPCVALDFVGDFDDGAAAYDAHAGFVVDGCAICPASARFVFGHSDVVVGWARPSVSGDLHASTVSAAVAVGSRHRCRR